MMSAPTAVRSATASSTSLTAMVAVIFRSTDNSASGPLIRKKGPTAATDTPPRWKRIASAPVSRS